jgi:hypothetical protein
LFQKFTSCRGLAVAAFSFFVDSPKSRMTGFARPQDAVCALIIVIG